MNDRSRDEAPYPADIKARGWKFDLDYERIVASDTWTLAPRPLRPWLLMLWFSAWQSIPAGSLPGDDTTIAGTIGMPLEEFERHRAVLMRGWWLANDGLYYHRVITEYVLDMVGKRHCNALRLNKWREKRVSNALQGGDDDVTRYKRVSNALNGDVTRCNGDVTRYQPAQRVSNTLVTRLTDNLILKNREQSSLSDATRCNEVTRNGEAAAMSRVTRAKQVEFELTPELREWARRFPTIDDEFIDMETAKFVLHYRATGAKMVDWNANWQKWMLNAVVYKRD